MNAEATERQRQATTPALSAWVTANAGSGKTHVLVNRIARLLLDGSAPNRLLCLTFTKAAASEMSIRLFDQLGRWTLMTDHELQNELMKLSGQAPDDDMVVRARRLFAEALESPGGLRIQTIHSFCERLLKRFPLEAGVAPEFSVLDEQATDEMLAEARDRVLREGIARDRDLLRAVSEITAHAGEQRMDELVRETVNARGWIEGFLAACGRAGIEDALRQTLGVAAFRTTDDVLRHAMSQVPVDRARSIGTTLARGTKTDQNKAGSFLAYAAAPSADTLQGLFDSLLTDKGQIVARLATKALLEAAPDLGPQLLALAEMAIAVRDQCNGLQVARQTGNLLLLANDVLAAYRDLKNQHSVLDYDDLIARAAALFDRPGAQWVLYKLDGGIDHILIDEAQDTSPSQWKIVRKISEEFFTGEGARRKAQAVVRTIFAVGDIKQSIMSFQGARPIEFLESQKFVAQHVSGGTTTFEHVRLTHSFRSAPSILTLVDEVFSDPRAAQGVLIEATTEPHRADRSDMPGFVEVWPLTAPSETGEALAWDAPRDRVTEENPAVVLAVRIARRIKSWIAARMPVHDKEGKALRAITPGDVMILVRRRGLLASEIIRQLKRLGIRVAGADRLVLADHIAVMDLVALGRFALMPDDDLTLATVLRGPCCGVSEADLFALAHDRTTTLWQALVARRQDAAWQAPHAFLSQLCAMADHVQPYEFYSTILGPMRGGARIMERLGLDAADPVEEFVSAALDYGRLHTPSLEGFLHSIEQARTEIKRDQDRSEGAVRVLTVHGSKGLEAPVVILPDTFATPEDGKLDSELLDANGTPLWKIKAAWDEPVRLDARRKDRDDRMCEYRRLLYVALTRPRDQLYVCGYSGKRDKHPEGNWHQLVTAAMTRLGAVTAVDADGIEVMRVGEIPSASVIDAAPPAAAPLGLSATAPDWLTASAPRESVIDEILPTERGVRARGEAGIAMARAAAMARGTAVHKVLEVIARAEARDWARVAEEMAQDLVEADDVAAVVGEALGVRTHPPFASLFGPGTFGEVALRGPVSWQGQTFRFPGRIDRVVVTSAEVLVVEFKTDRRVPATLADIPAAYVRQMAIYRKALGALFPDRRVSCAILWTAERRLSALPADLLDASEGVLDPARTAS